MMLGGVDVLAVDDPCMVSPSGLGQAVREAEPAARLPSHLLRHERVGATAAAQSFELPQEEGHVHAFDRPP